MQTTSPRLDPDTQRRQALARVYALLIELAERNRRAVTPPQAATQAHDEQPQEVTNEA